MPTMKTPGVYINELDAFPNSTAPVATAVPAFIGYTPKAEYKGKSYYNKAVKISSFADFKAYFMLESPAPSDSPQQYSPQYYLVEQATPPKGNYITINGKYYTVPPDPNTIYYFYNSIRMFYENGGGDAYIISVGSYGPTSNKPMDNSGHIVNPNIKLNELKAGLALLKDLQEPTMYICPDATLLSLDDNATLMQSMLLLAEETQTALCIFDIIGGLNPDPIEHTNDIQAFRENTGNNGLKWGAAYYPFIGTTTMQSNEMDFTNLFGGDIKQLEPLFSSDDLSNPIVKKLIADITSPSKPPINRLEVHTALINASSTYKQIIETLLKEANVLPPSAAMAGVYAMNDQNVGVWQAPANISIVGATSLPINLNDNQQQDLNVDAVSGKSINAIRFFNGRGILVWGARTLDGNNSDWRYISVRRSLTFIEQSIKAAARPFVFSPNNSKTWATVQAIVSGFLTDFWKEGGLIGNKPSEAFQVSCGLGTTMTADDILNGFLKIQVMLAPIRPAEFIIISIEQQQAKAG